MGKQQQPREHVKLIKGILIFIDPSREILMIYANFIHFSSIIDTIFLRYLRSQGEGWIINSTETHLFFA